MILKRRKNESTELEIKIVVRLRRWEGIVIERGHKDVSGGLVIFYFLIWLRLQGWAFIFKFVNRTLMICKYFCRYVILHMITFKNPLSLILTWNQTGNNWSGLIRYGLHFDLEHLAFPCSDAFVPSFLWPMALRTFTLTQRPDSRE